MLPRNNVMSAVIRHRLHMHNMLQLAIFLTWSLLPTKCCIMMN